MLLLNQGREKGKKKFEPNFLFLYICIASVGCLLRGEDMNMNMAGPCVFPFLVYLVSWLVWLGCVRGREEFFGKKNKQISW